MSILLKLFLVFSHIGLFNFGGGYAMLSFIQAEVVAERHWMTDTEFTDIVAISQMTPGPIGINCATYVGYTAVMNDAEMKVMFGNSPLLLQGMGVLGSAIATISVLWLPFIVMLLVSAIVLRYKNSIVLKSIFSTLRPAILGLLASAALSLMTTSNFGNFEESKIQFLISVIIAVTVFFGCKNWKWNPIYCIICCGFVGLIVYGVVGI
ncbi:MAG: chromate transporter [Bacteroidales bacterium]|nr:chromate transporter [Bacteroidales bacterium]